jgi:hypothetical protein
MFKVIEVKNGSIICKSRLSGKEVKKLRLGLVILLRNEP